MDPTQSPETQLPRSWVKLIVLAIVISILLVVVYFSPLKQYLSHIKELSERIRGFGPLAPLVLMGSVALLVAAGFSRLALCILAGMALGFWSGLVWAQLGSLLGNYVSFLIVRSLGRDWGRRMLSTRTNINNLVQQRGAFGVVMARQLPLPGLFINVGCALLPLRHLDFIVGTFVGQLPQAIPYTLIGAGLLQASLSKSILVIGLAVVLSLVALLSLRSR